jgi:hypothetical protein
MTLVRCNQRETLLCFLFNCINTWECHHFAKHIWDSSCVETRCRKTSVMIDNCKCMKVKEDESI